jgi:putative DNA-invertase from lambdoid prophage Rac
MVVTIDELNSIGIDITSVTEPFDTTSSQGKLMFHIISAFAEFERDLTAEKIRDGIAVARQSGKILGRPKVYVNMTKAKQLRAQGLSNRKIARRLGISARTLDRAFKGESLSNEDILKLREQNLSLREISKRLGISVGTVHQAINEPNQI